MIFSWGRKKKKAAEAEAREAAREPAREPPAELAAETVATPLVRETDVAVDPEENAGVGQAAPMPAQDAPDTRQELATDPEPALVPASDQAVKAETPSEPHTAEETEQPLPEPVVEDTRKKPGLFSRLASGLKRSSSKLSENVTALFTKRKLDDEALEDLEDLLLTSDLGAGPASRVIAALAKDKFDKEVTDEEVSEALAKVVADTLRPHEADLDLSGESPQVIVFVGVNGSGKTTTLGKIAAMMKREGRSAVLGAGDTFRAAAIEQLQVWGERAGCTVIARETGADAAGLAYDAYETAKAEGADVLLLDTAGRLQNKAELMEELRKIVRVLQKHDVTAPHHVLLVLDATVGQNALSQAAAFTEAAGVTGLIMTKLDGTAKGGVLVALADAHPDLPIYFTGVGEGVDDLAPFSADAFAAALADRSAELA